MRSRRDGFLHRFDRWTNLAGPARTALLEPLRERLSEPIPPPPGADVAAVQVLANAAPIYSNGGRVQEDFARRVALRFGWDIDAVVGDKAALREADALHMHLIASELFTFDDDGWSYPAPELRARLHAPRRLWELIADTLFTRHFVFASQPELALAAWVRGTLGDDSHQLHKEAVWEASLVEDRPLTPEQRAEVVGTTTAFTSTLARSLLLVEPGSTHPPHVLSPSGTIFALRALRAAALSYQRVQMGLEAVPAISLN